LRNKLKLLPKYHKYSDQPLGIQAADRWLAVESLWEGLWR